MTATSPAVPRAYDASTATAEEAAVRVPIEQYFQGHAKDDASCMRQAFLPTAHIESMREGPFTSWTREVYCERFKGTPAPDEATRVRRIDWIDVLLRGSYEISLPALTVTGGNAEPMKGSGTISWDADFGIRLRAATDGGRSSVTLGIATTNRTGRDAARPS